MSIQIIDGFKLNLSKPIDTRMVAANESVRNNIQYKYDGLRVFDLNDKKGYVWYDNTWNLDSSGGVIGGGSGGSLGTPNKLLKISNDGLSVSETNILHSNDNVSIGSTYVDSDYRLYVVGGIKTDGNLEATYLKGNGNNITDIDAYKITDGKLALARLTNGTPNQVLITNANNTPTWVDQNTLVVSNINVSNDATDSNQFITFVANSGSQGLRLHNSGNNQLAYNPSNSQLLLTNLGSNIKPSYSFLNATGTGMYNSNGLGISFNSTERIKIDGTAIYLSKPDGTNGINVDNTRIFFGPVGSNNTYNPMIRLQNVVGTGSPATPDYTWSWDDNTGIFHPTQGVVGISSYGSEVARFTNTGLSVNGSISSSGSISSVSGTDASNPSYRFLGTTTGIYGSQFGLGISVNSVEKIYFNSDGDTTLISTNFKFNTGNVTTIATFNSTGLSITGNISTTSYFIGVGTTPIGSIIAFGGVSIPSGWLECDGTSLDRTTYSSLFTAIGTYWGSYTTTTFNLPDLRGAFLRGQMQPVSKNFTFTNVNTGSDTITVTGHGITRSAFPIRFVKGVSTNTLPNSFSTTDVYYAIVIDANTIKISSTPGGSAIDITSQGSGTNSIIYAVDPDYSSRIVPFGTSGINIGSYQSDEFKSHRHSTYANDGGGNNDGTTAQSVSSTKQGGYDTNYTGGNETRPINAYVKYIIYTGKI